MACGEGESAGRRSTTDGGGGGGEAGDDDVDGDDGARRDGRCKHVNKVSRRLRRKSAQLAAHDGERSRERILVEVQTSDIRVTFTVNLQATKSFHATAFRVLSE